MTGQKFFQSPLARIVCIGCSMIQAAIADTYDRSRMCQQCDHRVSLLDRVCWNCGVSGPARVPISVCVLSIVAPIMLLLGYIWLK